ncbi:hypothetical protein MSMAS_1780 [Methanosarcina mazei S-6]|uniref:Uncharacterized protein n=1 Tax=Methanosarcina mazei S-6 TaxID=213585 RepID=A0A0E3LUB4_METMZ|nr:hypothetical protein MSMAS_1780 [Methanosarcina mazei S-6]
MGERIYGTTVSGATVGTMAFGRFLTLPFLFSVFAVLYFCYSPLLLFSAFAILRFCYSPLLLLFSCIFSLFLFSLLSSFSTFLLS